MVLYPGTHAIEIMAIGVCPKNNGSEGPHQKTRTEGHERQHQGYEWIATGEKGIANRGCVITKHHEVIHLQKIPAGDAHYRPDLRFPISERGHGLRPLDYLA